MKSTLLTLTALFLTAGIASADPPDAASAGHRPPIERLATDLQLDDYQKGEVERILEAQHESMRMARAQSEASGERPSHEEMRKRHEQMQQETLKALKPILTEEQLQKFQTLMKDRRREPPGPPPERRDQDEE